ncbi:MAG: 4-(cytidine 5'-diphospho)-2-C-methyl-D-erythritol kinase [Burkholderiaceae bacterium]|nr:4-(cytidine 5'-diphospho)-2-C-methyl-D-erythritol kinase [Burkholderiaceae bacterium]
MSTQGNELRCFAPAKLNLFLHVIGRRDDGYHLLQTAFQLLDYGDTIHINTRSDGALRRIASDFGVPEEQDLIIRAAQLLKANTGTHFGADLQLEKRLPMGGGLGGGSSDAASTLIGLNHLWQCGLNRRELMELGLQLGADVPFFIFGQNAFAEGVGEQLQALSTNKQWYVVIEPGVQVPTPLIFSAKELTRDTKPVRITDFSNRLKNNWKNDLQAVASTLFPAVKDALEWLAQYGNAMMTGSGACVFCAFDSEAVAQQVSQQVPQKWQAWIAKSLHEHPMRSLVKD